MNLSRRMKAGIAVLSLALPLAVWAAAPHEVPTAKADTGTDTRNTITVSGEGQVFTPSDEAVLTLGVTSIQKTAALAMSENSKAMTKVLAAIKAKGLTDGEIKTGNVSLYPQQDYKEGQVPKILAYTANNQVIVKTKKLDKLGLVIDVATTAGATEVNQLVFQLSENSAATVDAMKNAVKNARRKADTLAGEVGATLGKAVMVSEGSNPNYTPYLGNTGYAMLESVKSEAAPIMPQDVQVTANVQIMYEIK